MEEISREDLMAEIEKIKQQVDYYRKELDTVNKLYGKEILDHKETKKGLHAVLVFIEDLLTKDVATKMTIQSSVTEYMGDLIKSANVSARGKGTIAGFRGKLEEEMKKEGQQQQQQ